MIFKRTVFSTGINSWNLGSNGGSAGALNLMHSETGESRILVSIDPKFLFEQAANTNVLSNLKCELVLQILPSELRRQNVPFDLSAYPVAGTFDIGNGVLRDEGPNAEFSEGFCNWESKRSNANWAIAGAKLVGQYPDTSVDVWDGDGDDNFVATTTVSDFNSSEVRFDVSEYVRRRVLDYVDTGIPSVVRNAWFGFVICFTNDASDSPHTSEEVEGLTLGGWCSRNSFARPTLEVSYANETSDHSNNLNANAVQSIRLDYAFDGVRRVPKFGNTDIIGEDCMSVRISTGTWSAWFTGSSLAKTYTGEFVPGVFECFVDLNDYLSDLVVAEGTTTLQDAISVGTELKVEWFETITGDDNLVATTKIRAYLSGGIGDTLQTFSPNEMCRVAPYNLQQTYTKQQGIVPIRVFVEPPSAAKKLTLVSRRTMNQKRSWNLSGMQACVVDAYTNAIVLPYHDVFYDAVSGIVFVDTGSLMVGRTYYLWFSDPNNRCINNAKIEFGISDTNTGVARYR